MKKSLLFVLALLALLSFSCSNDNIETNEANDSDTGDTMIDSINPIDTNEIDLKQLAGPWMLMIEEKGFWRQTIGYYSEMAFSFTTDGDNAIVNYGNDGGMYTILKTTWQNDSSFTLELERNDPITGVIHYNWKGDTVDVLEINRGTPMYDFVDESVLFNSQRQEKLPFKLFRYHQDYRPTFLHENDKEFYDHEEGINRMGCCEWFDIGYSDELLTTENMLEVLNCRNGLKTSLHPETGNIEYLRMPNDKMIFIISYQDGDLGGYQFYSLDPSLLVVYDHISISGNLPKLQVVDDETISISMSKISYSEDMSSQLFEDYTVKFYINEDRELIKLN